jgi:signal transduction histidine kinase
MKYFIIAVSIIELVFIQHVNSQNIDSVKLLHQKTWDLTYSAPDSALQYANQAKRLAVTKEQKDQVARSNLLIGIIYDVKGKYDSAMLYHHMALKNAIEVNDTSLIASSHSNIGLTFWHVGSYYKALENFFASLSFFESLAGSNPNKANVYNNIGLLYSELKEYEKSIGYFRKAGSLYKKNEDLLGQGAVLTNMAVHYSLTGNLAKAIELIDSSISVKETTRDYYGLAIAYNEKASIQIKQDQNEPAYQSILQALSYSKTVDDPSTQAASYHLLQKIFRLQGSFSKAIRYNQMALEIAKEIKDGKLITENYLNMSEIYKDMGDFRKSYEFYTRYVSSKDSLVNQQQLNNIYTIEFRHQLEKQADEIFRLQEQQELQALKIERQELKLSKRNLQMILFAGAFILVLLFIYIRYLRSRHRHRRILMATLMQQKDRQAKKIIDAEMNERKRISQELHDSLGQLLSLVKLNLSKQQDKNDVETKEYHRKKRDETLNIVDQAITELRNITHNLSPVMMKEKGLKVTLMDMVQRLRKVSSIDIGLELHDIEKLDDDLIGNTVFSVIQEALNNAIKHSECNRVDVQVINSESEINIMVEDNGKGFDEKQDHTGLGIKLIRTKVSNLGGRMEIDSRKGRGTIISIEIPTKIIFEI